MRHGVAAHSSGENHVQLSCPVLQTVLGLSGERLLPHEAITFAAAWEYVKGRLQLALAKSRMNEASSSIITLDPLQFGARGEMTTRIAETLARLLAVRYGIRASVTTREQYLAIEILFDQFEIGMQGVA